MNKFAIGEIVLTPNGETGTIINKRWNEQRSIQYEVKFPDNEIVEFASCQLKNLTPRLVRNPLMDEESFDA